MRLAALVFALSLGLVATAQAAPQKGLRASLQAGAIGLFGDLNSQGTRSGVGAGLAYQLDDQYSIDFRYLGASFEDVDHRDVDVGVSWYLPEDSNQSHLSAGFSFLHNDFKLLSRSGDAAGVYFGGGMSWEIAERLAAGYDLRFHKTTPTKATIAGREITTVSDSYTLMFNLNYTPDFSD